MRFPACSQRSEKRTGGRARAQSSPNRNLTRSCSLVRVIVWAASGRALGMDRSEGFTKLIFDQPTRRIIGAGITGPNAGELIAECALAIEMGCEAEDLSLTIHPHPTLSESISMAAEVFEGTITDLYVPRKKS